MYHYVRPQDSDYPDLKYLHVEDFKLQLDYFQENFGIITKAQWHYAIETGQPCEGVVLTFDDGLADHYDYVYPILKERGLWGIFYVSSGPYTSNKLLDVHKVHLLLGCINAAVVHSELINLIDDSMLIAGANERFSNNVYLSQDSDALTKEVKKIINYCLKPECKQSVLDDLVHNLLGSETDLIKKLYLSEHQILEMHNDGFSFGGHAKTHTLLSNLPDNILKDEIIDSIDLIKRIVGKDESVSFCYPYGGEQSYNDYALACLRSAKVPFSFSVDARDITTNDLADKLQELPRYDCNMFPHGQVRDSGYDSQLSSCSLNQ